MRKRPRLLLSCTCEDRADFHARVEMLLGSARRLGGSLASSPPVVNVVGGADPAFAAMVVRNTERYALSSARHSLERVRLPKG